MKKLLSILAAFTLVFGVGSNAFAEGKEYQDVSTVEIKKSLLVTPQGSNPTDTFTFKVGEGTYTRDDGPKLEKAPSFPDKSFKIEVKKGEKEGVTNIKLPEFNKVGVYTYPITEEIGDTEGMTYNNTPKYLVVTVINNLKSGQPKFLRILTLTDENNLKNDSFKNEFNAGSLTIEKKVDGNYSDPNDEFEVIVTLKASEGKVFKNEMIKAEKGIVTNVGEGTSGEVTITYTVKDGSEYTIYNIPVGVEYTVVETGENGVTKNGYDISYTENSNGTITTADSNPVVTITNTRNNDDIKTGISLDSIPYILLLGFAVVGIGALFLRKRENANF